MWHDLHDMCNTMTQHHNTSSTFMTRPNNINHIITSSHRHIISSHHLVTSSNMIPWHLHHIQIHKMKILLIFPYYRVFLSVVVHLGFDTNIINPSGRWYVEDELDQCLVHEWYDQVEHPTHQMESAYGQWEENAKRSMRISYMHGQHRIEHDMKWQDRIRKGRWARPLWQFRPRVQW